MKYNNNFHIGQVVTWRQNWNTRDHPMSETGVVEEIKPHYNAESGIMIKVSFYRHGFLDSNWLKPAELS